jgi:predicted amidohydrolase
MSLDQVTVASVQFDPHIFDPGYNLEKIETLTRQAVREHGAQLVVFPEAAITGYCFRSREEAAAAAVTEDGPELSRLLALCRKEQVSMAVGAVEQEGEALYNTVFFLEPEGEVQSYRKSHLPYLGLDRFVTEGETSGGIFDTRFGRIGIIVCYELRFPEAARIPALRGARLILQPTNQPEGGDSHADFFTRARACENRVYLVSCNRVGREGGFTFIGRSQIVDFNGAVLAECGRTEEAIIARTLDLTLCEDKDIIGTPGERELYLYRDRRWDLYRPLAQDPDERGFLP